MAVRGHRRPSTIAQDLAQRRDPTPDGDFFATSSSERSAMVRAIF